MVGLYLNPPERAVVFSFDEEAQVHALNRTQPSLSMRPGRAGTMTHDYKRNGTTELFAALKVGTGEVITDCRKHPKGPDVPRFFKLIDLHVPRRLDVHVVLDNLSAHRAPEVASGGPTRNGPVGTALHPHQLELAEPRRALVPGADRPTAATGRFDSVAALIDAIETWVEHWSDDPKPFVWHKTADEIVAKVRRGRAALPEVNPRRRTSPRSAASPAVMLDAGWARHLDQSS